MQANICTHLTTTESRAKIWPAKYIYAPSAGYSAILYFFVVALIVFEALVFSSVFVVYFFMSFLVTEELIALLIALSLLCACLCLSEP